MSLMPLRDEHRYGWPVLHHDSRRTPTVLPQQLTAPQPGVYHVSNLGLPVCPRLHRRLSLDVNRER